MEQFSEALRLSGIGIGVVFLGLSLLILVLMALGRLFSRGNMESLVEPGGIEEPQEQGEPDSEQEMEEVAAVAAALTVSEGFWDAGYGGPTGTSTGWRLQGRQRLLGSQGTRQRGWWS